MRFCRLRKKRGGAKEFQFEKPSAKFSSSGQALENYNKQEAVQNKADSAALQKGGKGEITVPTMNQGGAEGNDAIKTAVSGLAKSDADGEFDTPPKLEGGRRTKRKRKRKKGRRLTKICVKKCTRKCYTPKRGGKRRKTRRKNRKKRTRRRGGVRSPSKKTPPKKKQPKSPPRKQWPQRKYSIPSTVKEPYIAKKETYNPEILLKGPKPKKTNAPRHSNTATVEAFIKARQIAEAQRPVQKVFRSGVIKVSKGKGGRKTRKRMRKRKRKKTRK